MTPEAPDVLVHNMFMSPALEGVRNFRDRIRSGTSEWPPYLMWPELEDKVNSEIVGNPGFMEVYGVNIALSAEELADAADSVLQGNGLGER